MWSDQSGVSENKLPKKSNCSILFLMNWTSTTVPMWQIDCENYRKVGGIFHLKDVTTEEHHMFIKLFCARYDYVAKMAGTTAIFSKAEDAPAKDSN